MDRKNNTDDLFLTVGKIAGAVGVVTSTVYIGSLFGAFGPLFFSYCIFAYGRNIITSKHK